MDILLLVTLNLPIVEAQEWISPTGFNDPDSKWADEPNAYDSDTVTYATNTIPGGIPAWGSFLELTLPSTYSNKLKFNALWSATITDEIDIDVYKDTVWIHVYQGIYPHNTDTEKTFTSGEVTKVRVRFHFDGGAVFDGRLYEVSIWELPTPPPNPNYFNLEDGNVIFYGGIYLKPNTIHTYIPQFNGRYQNITLHSGTLGLSKSTYAYDIACSTNDNVTINLYKWIYSDITQFKPYAQDESALSFTLNSRNKGEPQGVTGVSSWSYDEDTTTVALSCTNNTMVTIRWESEGTKQVVWWLDRIPMWIGIGGIFLIMIAPALLVYYGKQDEWGNAFTYGLMFAVIGMALVIGWLWG